MTNREFYTNKDLKFIINGKYIEIYYFPKHAQVECMFLIDWIINNDTMAAIEKWLDKEYDKNKNTYYYDVEGEFYVKDN